MIPRLEGKKMAKEGLQSKAPAHKAAREGVREYADKGNAMGGHQFALQAGNLCKKSLAHMSTKF